MRNGRAGMRDAGPAAKCPVRPEGRAFPDA